MPETKWVKLQGDERYRAMDKRLHLVGMVPNGMLG